MRLYRQHAWGLTGWAGHMNFIVLSLNVFIVHMPQSIMLEFLLSYLYSATTLTTYSYTVSIPSEYAALRTKQQQMAPKTYHNKHNTATNQHASPTELVFYQSFSDCLKAHTTESTRTFSHLSHKHTVIIGCIPGHVYALMLSNCNLPDINIHYTCSTTLTGAY